MSHWYYTDGAPNHDIGKRDARKLGVLPSVTGVFDVAAKDGLMYWAVNLVFNTGDKEAPKKVAEAAAKWGSKFHDMAEKWLVDGIVDNGNKIQMEAMKNFTEYWIKDLDNPELLWSERSFGFVSPDMPTLGFGGTVDLLFENSAGELVLADFKTKDKLPARPYDTNILQLAAYNEAVEAEFGRPADKYLIIYVSRETGEIKPIEIKPDESYRTEFYCYLQVWWLQTMRSGTWAEFSPKFKKDN